MLLKKGNESLFLSNRHILLLFFENLRFITIFGEKY